MDDVRQPEPPADETAEQRFKRRLRTPPGPLSDAAKQWMEENREAIDQFNDWYEKNGSPLDRYRTF